MEQDTTLRKHGYRKSTLLIGVGIEVSVRCANRGVLRVDTSTISVGLVRVVLHIVVGSTCVIAVRSQTLEFKTTNGLPSELTLELEVGNAEVNVVLVKLVEDIERCIVTSVSSIGVGNARGVQRVAIGVDIEATAIDTIHHVNILTQCTRSALLTITITSQQLDGQSL